MEKPVDDSAEGNPRPPSETLVHADERATASGTMLVAEDVAADAQVRVSSPLRDAVRRFRRNWAAMASLGVIALLILGAIFAPFLHTMDPTVPDFLNLHAPPEAGHWFGTDPEGRDEYSRILYGLRVPFIVSFVGTFLTVVVGTGLGLLAGYYGRWWDTILSRFTDLMFAFPAFLLAVIIVSLFGGTFDRAFPSGVGRAIILTGVFALVSWPPLMRFVRSLALSMKETQFIEAARTVGTRDRKIIVRHLLPNVYGLVLVQASLTVAYIIGAEAVLSILGLGVNEPTPDLGAMLYDGAQYMDRNFAEVLFPSLFLTILIVAFTFIGDGIRDAVDPRSSQ